MARRHQFSLRALLASIVGVSAAVAVLTREPSWHSLAALGLLAVLFFAVSLTVMMNTFGNVRTFWLGMVIATGFAAFHVVIAIAFDSSFVEMIHWGNADSTLASCMAGVRRVVPFLWGFGPIVGIACVVARHLLFTSQENGS